MVKVDWKKFIIVFFITAIFFATGIYLSNYLSNRKINQIRDTQDKISIDILSSETRFALLKQASCADSKGDSILSGELGSLGHRLEFMESQLGNDNIDVLQLKKYYSISQIKDYLLMNEVKDRCKVNPHFILYFYSNKSDCSDCKKQGYALTSLREKYPSLRVYSFDYNLDLSAIGALISIYKISDKLPAMVVDGKVFYGFQGIEDVEKLIPALKTIEKKDATKPATTTFDKTTETTPNNSTGQ